MAEKEEMTRELEVVWRFTATATDDRPLGPLIAALMAKLARGDIAIQDGEELSVPATQEGWPETTIKVRTSFVNVYREGARVVDIIASKDVEEAAKAEHFSHIQAAGALH